MFFETDASEESVIRYEKQANRASFKRTNDRVDSWTVCIYTVYMNRLPKSRTDSARRVFIQFQDVRVFYIIAL